MIDTKCKICDKPFIKAKHNQTVCKSIKCKDQKKKNNAMIKNRNKVSLQLYRLCGL